MLDRLYLAFGYVWKEVDLDSAFIVVPTLKALRYRSHSFTCPVSHQFCYEQTDEVVKVPYLQLLRIAQEKVFITYIPHGGVIMKESDSDSCSRGREFNSRPFDYHVTMTQGSCSLFTHMWASVT